MAIEQCKVMLLLSYSMLAVPAIRQINKRFYRGDNLTRGTLQVVRESSTTERYGECVCAWRSVCGMRIDAEFERATQQTSAPPKNDDTNRVGRARNGAAANWTNQPVVGNVRLPFGRLASPSPNGRWMADASHRLNRTSALVALPIALAIAKKGNDSSQLIQIYWLFNGWRRSLDSVTTCAHVVLNVHSFSIYSQRQIDQSHRQLTFKLFPILETDKFNLEHIIDANVTDWDLAPLGWHWTANKFNWEMDCTAFANDCNCTESPANLSSQIRHGLLSQLTINSIELKSNSMRTPLICSPFSSLHTNGQKSFDSIKSESIC